MASSTVIRVLVLEASPPRRQRLQRLLATDPSLQVVAGVGSAAQAIEAAARLHADVILLGQGQALADAVAATRSIMQARATPIVVVTGATTPVEERHAFSLIEAGALSVVHDPGPGSGAQHAEALRGLLTALRLMAEVRVVRRWAPAGARPRPAPAPRRIAPPAIPVAEGPPAPGRPARSLAALVAIGASTGGPVALRQVLGALPADFAVPIVIVQHMADGFLHGLADWLSASCPIPTQIAAPGTRPRPGCAYLAPDGVHMRVTPEGTLNFDAAPPVNGHRPAVSCLFASVADHYGSRAVGILLTGMGRDGAAELKQMKDAGAVTIAQDEPSSVVHGMPGEAIRCGGATFVMSPEEIGAALPALVLR